MPRPPTMPYHTKGASMRLYSLIGDAIRDELVIAPEPGIWDEELQAFVDPASGEVVNDRPLAVTIMVNEDVYFHRIKRRHVSFTLPPETEKLYRSAMEQMKLRWREGTLIVLLSLLSADLDIEKARELAAQCGVERNRKYFADVRDRVLKYLQEGGT